MVIDPLPGTQLEIKDTPTRRRAVIAPTTLTPTGAEPMRGGNTDLWMFNNEGFLVRIHKRLRKALFTPDNTGCPVPTEHLDNLRRTSVKRADGQHQDITDAYKNLASRTQIPSRNSLDRETWFRVNRGSPTEVTQSQRNKCSNKCVQQADSQTHNKDANAATGGAASNTTDSNSSTATRPEIHPTCSRCTANK